MFSVTNLVLWMFLAILLENYTAVREESHKGPSVWEEAGAYIATLPRTMTLTKRWRGGRLAFERSHPQRRYMCALFPITLRSGSVFIAGAATVMGANAVSTVDLQTDFDHMINGAKEFMLGAGPLIALGLAWWGKVKASPAAQKASVVASGALVVPTDSAAAAITSSMTPSNTRPKSLYVGRKKWS